VSPSIKVLFENDEILVIDKPSGILCHNLDQGPKEITILSLLKSKYQQDFFLCHRLDRGTSGALCLAKSKVALSKFSKYFEDGVVEKKYLTICRGHPPEKFSVNRPLKPKQFASTNLNPKDALTDFERKEIFEWTDKFGTKRKYALMSAFPKTGRTHQIRRHLRGEGFPIIGDRVYGKSEHNNFFRDHLQSNRLLLHCEGLKFPEYPWISTSCHSQGAPRASGSPESLLTTLRHFFARYRAHASEQPACVQIALAGSVAVTTDLCQSVEYN